MSDLREQLKQAKDTYQLSPTNENRDKLICAAEAVKQLDPAYGQKIASDKREAATKRALDEMSDAASYTPQSEFVRRAHSYKSIKHLMK